MVSLAEFEAEVKRLISVVPRQYPRPWMTDMTNPLEAKVFIVGHNQAKTFPREVVGSPDVFLDALFNRNGQTCRGLYDRVLKETGEKTSRTRPNIEKLTASLKARGVKGILETNVICLSSPDQVTLFEAGNAKVIEDGRKIFRTLIDIIRPSVIIAYGKDTNEELGVALGVSLGRPPYKKSKTTPELVYAQVTSTNYKGYKPFVFASPHLVPTQYNTLGWVPDYLDKVVKKVAEIL